MEKWRSGVEEKRRSGEVIGFVSRNAGWGCRRDASGTGAVWGLGSFRVFWLLAVGFWQLALWNWVCFAHLGRGAGVDWVCFAFFRPPQADFALLNILSFVLSPPWARRGGFHIQVGTPGRGFGFPADW